MAAKKEVSMLVTVRVPAWLTAAQARKEVRALIQHQAFWGHVGAGGVEIDESTLKLARIRPG